MSETARATRLEQLLRHAHAEIAALRTARDAALKVAAWGAPRLVEGTTVMNIKNLDTSDHGAGSPR